MQIEDFFIPPTPIATEPWQMGSLMTDDLQSGGGVALLLVSDYRGSGLGVENSDFGRFRNEFYRLSRQEFSLPITDLGELRAGKTFADTLYIVQELALSCLQKGVFPIVIGGSNALSHSLFSAVNCFENNLHFTQISNILSLKNRNTEIDDENFLSHIFSDKDLSLKEFNILGYQKHLTDAKTSDILTELDGTLIRLGELMNNPNKAEPYFRHADLVSLNCDAVESFAEDFSINPQVNGLNKREICAMMRDIGLGRNLKSLGIFNFNFKAKNHLHYQLLAQMLWYFLEGFYIQRTHPKAQHFEKFVVMFGDGEWIFRRDTFSNLWYFGNDEHIQNCTPCTQEDYENAKKGIISNRLK